MLSTALLLMTSGASAAPVPLIPHTDTHIDDANNSYASAARLASPSAFTKGECNPGSTVGKSYQCGTGAGFSMDLLTASYIEEHFGIPTLKNCADSVNYVMYFQTQELHSEICHGEPTKTNCKTYPSGEFCEYTWVKCLRMPDLDPKSPLLSDGCDAFKAE